MPRNQEERVLAQVQKVLNQFSDWGLVAGFVYTTQQGLVKVLGSEAVVELVSRHQRELESHPAFVQQFAEETEVPDSVPLQVII